MTDDPKPTVSETDLALISFARVVLDVLYATNLVRPTDIDPLLGMHETLMTDGGFPIAAGILGSIRQMSNDPTREQMRKGLRKLIRGRIEGSA